MATVFTLTPQPIRVTAAVTQPIYLAADISGYDALDVELLCSIEGTATNAAINLYTGMQTDTDDGWLVPTGSFSPISGTGQQAVVAHVASGLLQFLRWNVSSLGGATAITFYLRGVARNAVGGGASSTLAAAYNLGTSASDQLLALSSAHGAGPVVRWDGLNGTPVGQVAGLALSNAAAATAGAGTQQWSPGLQLTGQQWNGSASVPVDWMVQARPVSGSSFPSALSFLTRYNGGTWGVGLEFLNDGAGSPRLQSAGTPATSIDFGNNLLLNANGGSVIPSNTLALTLGYSTRIWTEIWGRRHAGVEQTVAAAATISIDPALGETIRVTLGATAITTVNAGAGLAGERISVEIIQDGTGSRSISGWSASWVFAGGAYTATATANKRDVLTFIWDGVASKWYEASRAMNL